MVYSYICDKCNHKFNVVRTREKYKPKESCEKCNKKRHVRRDFLADFPTCSVKLHKSEIKQLGHLAGRNRDTMSDDQKDELWLKHNDYRFETPEKELPRGMHRVKKEKKVPVELRFAEKKRRKITRKPTKHA